MKGFITKISQSRITNHEVKILIRMKGMKGKWLKREQH